MTSNFRIRRALFIASCVVLPLSVSAIGRHFFDAATSIRLTGVLTGALLVIWANAMPKMLVPLDKLSCAPAREQSLRRLAAWAMVLGGMGYLLAFALAPIAIASTLAICILAPAVVVVAGIAARCAWRRRNARRGGA
jgi:hypothetical protein